METFNRIVKQFGSIMAMFAVGVGAYFEARMAIRDNTREIKELRVALDGFVARDLDRSAFGPDGFLDPKIRAGLEANIRKYLEIQGFTDRKFREAFFQLNPTIIKPKDDK